MTLSTTQGSIWKMVTQVYGQWDPDWNRLMPEAELQKLLPAVPADVLDDTLETAARDQLAELGNVGEERAFRPVQR
ncbi:MAG TPA: hypothetical protein VEC01_14670 [Noviherbaspirillum sp.]|uniref:hypothetical protein n=1 Tax=Noviherbaspirillum sp. TaxID=1926288 RepID=UPI002D48E149|nr:hypothetical protein [Noviherbaspirillum sp.]HYD96570.1 hypothetical protein [Noviherbaspirillum sp.]